MNSIYHYIDFRKFLSDYYIDKKQNTRHFSYRYFCQKAGINSSSFLKQVIDGRRKLTPKMTEKFCKALDLKAKEEIYFRHLILFNQAQTAHVKQEHYAVLRSMVGQVKESALKSNQYEYYEKWYTSVLRELICLANFNDDFKMIAGLIQPSITPGEAKKAVQILLKLGLVQKKSNGEYEQTSKAIVADDSITTLALKAYIAKMFNLTGYALQNIKNTQRNISTMSLGCSPETYDVLSAEINAFKDRMKIIINRDTNSSRVYQLNIGLLPLSNELSSQDPENGRVL